MRPIRWVLVPVAVIILLVEWMAFSRFGRLVWSDWLAVAAAVGVIVACICIRVRN